MNTYYSSLETCPSLGSYPLETFFILPSYATLMAMDGTLEYSLGESPHSEAALVAAIQERRPPCGIDLRFSVPSPNHGTVKEKRMIVWVEANCWLETTAHLLGYFKWSSASHHPGYVVLYAHCDSTAECTRHWEWIHQYLVTSGTPCVTTYPAGPAPIHPLARRRG